RLDETPHPRRRRRRRPGGATPNRSAADAWRRVRPDRGLGGFLMRIALIGLGEVGRVLAAHLSSHDPSITLTAWDIAFAEPGSRAVGNVKALPVRAASDAIDPVTGADLVLSAVTAANDLTAATQAAEAIAGGRWFVDLN